MRRFAILMTVLLLPASAFAGEPAPRGIMAWDTVEAAPALLRLSGKSAWIQLGASAEAFKGDAVISNGRLAAVLRRKDAAVDLHSVKADGSIARIRVRLQSATGEPAVSVENIALIDNSKTSVTLEAKFKTAKGAALAAKYRLKKGDVALQVEPLDGAGKLRMECASRFVILPDFFADDITLDATKLPLASVELPSENFVLHPIGKGDVLAMCVFENRQQDLKCTLEGKGENRQVTGSEIGFEKKKVWIALLEAPQIWHHRNIAATEEGKIVNLDWKMPYAAQWRIDFTRDGDLTSSWEMLLQDRGYVSYQRPTWLGKGEETFAASREHWNTVLGTYPYPAWTDADGQGFAQPIQGKFLKFAGPALIYPIHRVKGTPLDSYTVVDVMRSTLGVGPCEHILDVQSHTEQYKGQATCGVRDILNPIYAKGNQKQKKKTINKTLDDGLIFVKHIRSRIDDYVTFGKKTREYLAEQRKKNPELADFLDEMDKLTAEIDVKFGIRKDKIKTPDHVAKMNEDFRKNVLDYDGPDAADRCKAYTHALWIIGDNQDELSGELRWVVRTLRQRAGIRQATDARVTPIATEIRNRTQQVLRNPAWHEGARH